MWKNVILKSEMSGKWHSCPTKLCSRCSVLSLHSKTFAVPIHCSSMTLGRDVCFTGQSVPDTGRNVKPTISVVDFHGNCGGIFHPKHWKAVTAVVTQSTQKRCHCWWCSFLAPKGLKFGGHNLKTRKREAIRGSDKRTSVTCWEHMGTITEE